MTTAREATVEAAEHELDERLAQIGGCSDGNCIVVKPKGMHTNGGCQCWRDPMKMQRLTHAYLKYRSSRQLSPEGEGWVRVPVEPTEAMIKAGENAWMRHNHGEPYTRELPDIWSSMIAAAPAGEKA